jgi:hypothetical protein
MKQLTAVLCVLLVALIFGGCAPGYGHSPYYYGYAPSYGNYPRPQPYYQGGYSRQPYYGGGYGHGHHGDDD